MIVHRPTMKLLQVTELTEQVVTFNICAVKAAEKVAIDNADDVPAEQAVPGEPELKQTPIKQSKMMKQQFMLSRVTMKCFKTTILMKNFFQSQIFKKARLMIKKYYPLSILCTLKVGFGKETSVSWKMQKYVQIMPL